MAKVSAAVFQDYVVYPQTTRNTEIRKVNAVWVSAIILLSNPG